MSTNDQLLFRLHYHTQFIDIFIYLFVTSAFRWDQRIFVLLIGDMQVQDMHPQLKALCEVTGGAYMKIQSVSALSKLMTKMYPPRPKACSIPDPLKLPNMPASPHPTESTNNLLMKNVFVNGGPICCFESMDANEGRKPSLHRAMLMFAGSCEQTRWILNPTQSENATSTVQQPVWCIPEIFFPSKKLDTLPPRPSQPLLHYSRSYQAVGCPVFDPMYVMKALHHLDQQHVSIHQLLVDSGDSPPPIANRMLQRDVYVTEWLGGNESEQKMSGTNESGAPRTVAGKEHFPVCVRGAGRPTVSGEGDDNILNIGILHVPQIWNRLKELESKAQKSRAVPSNLSTLTLLPPDPHILIPLLIRIADMELRALKKNKEKGASSRPGATADFIKKSHSVLKAVHVDDQWKSDFRGWLFRLPPYYFPAIRRVLRPFLPPSVLSLLSPDGQESLPLLCFSRTCLEKIKAGEKANKDGNDWLRSIERDLSQRGKAPMVAINAKVGNDLQQKALPLSFGYGQYDPRMSEYSYKSSLRDMPPPWKENINETPVDANGVQLSAMGILGELPSSCLLPYYESRRRWIFGGTGLTTQGLHVEGVNNDGVNTQHYSASHTVEDEPLIALACVGANTVNETSITTMGDFRERLHWSRAPLTGYGGSNATGSSITTAADGSPTYSCDDDFFPMQFFDSKTGEFVDNPQIRARARVMIHFGNPFEEKRGGSIVPEKYASQRPPSHVGENGQPNTPPGSPPHDAYESVEDEGEGEAAFTSKRPASPPRGPRHELSLKRRKSSSEAKSQMEATLKQHPPPPPPPPRPLKTGDNLASPYTKGTNAHESSSPQTRPQHPPSKPAQPSPLQSGMAKPAPPKRNNIEELQPPQHQAQPAKTQAPAVSDALNAAQLQNPDVKPQVSLPPGWICAWSKSQKRWYFFNTNTNKSVWEYQNNFEGNSK